VIRLSAERQKAGLDLSEACVLGIDAPASCRLGIDRAVRSWRGADPGVRQCQSESPGRALSLRFRPMNRQSLPHQPRDLKMYTQAYRPTPSWGAAHDPSGTRNRDKGIFSFLTRAVEFARQDRRSRHVVAELAALDDRLLRDIGISRWEIAGYARLGRRDGGRS
jgi:uncharacterized protein YjiS (DUF1127 family)